MGRLLPTLLANSSPQTHRVFSWIISILVTLHQIGTKAATKILHGKVVSFVLNNAVKSIGFVQLVTITIKRYSTVKNFRSILTQLVVSWRISFREKVQHLMPSFSFVPVLLIVIYKARFKVAKKWVVKDKAFALQYCKQSLVSYHFSDLELFDVI